MKRRTLGERLELVMSEMGWKPADLARAAGCTPQAVSNWLAGRNKNMDPEYAYRLEDRFQWNARWLLEDEGAERITPLTAREQRILAKIRSIPEEERDAVDLILDRL